MTGRFSVSSMCRPTRWRNSADANTDSGYSSGAQVALVTKSGTNNFHGSAYEYNRNTIFSANDPFLKEAQGVSGEANKAPKLSRNVFGATVGGPIKRNRLFFFTDYEGRRDAQGTSVLRTVPSATLRQGAVEYLCPLQANGQIDTATCPGGHRQRRSRSPTGLLCAKFKPDRPDGPAHQRTERPESGGRDPPEPVPGGQRQRRRRF